MKFKAPLAMLPIVLTLVFASVSNAQSRCEQLFDIQPNSTKKQAKLPSQLTAELRSQTNAEQILKQFKHPLPKPAPPETPELDIRVRRTLQSWAPSLFDRNFDVKNARGWRLWIESHEPYRHFEEVLNLVSQAERASQRDQFDEALQNELNEVVEKVLDLVVQESRQITKELQGHMINELIYSMTTANLVSERVQLMQLVKSLELFDPNLIQALLDLREKSIAYMNSQMVKGRQAAVLTALEVNEVFTHFFKVFSKSEKDALARILIDSTAADLHVVYFILEQGVSIPKSVMSILRYRFLQLQPMDEMHRSLALLMAKNFHKSGMYREDSIRHLEYFLSMMDPQAFPEYSDFEQLLNEIRLTLPQSRN